MRCVAMQCLPLSGAPLRLPIPRCRRAGAVTAVRAARSPAHEARGAIASARRAPADSAGEYACERVKALLVRNQCRYR